MENTEFGINIRRIVKYMLKQRRNSEKKYKN
uniref:Uncharacterized protein n=1 Tax=virus sp. ctrcb4 TaxID=2825824 RepID=A0A8S5RPD1_9VIRU|nr:MAG TPA: hypothetical protein [virus sp. ctrcb4]DAR12577.1 MAG TPA: hypothetical protein [Crassvirales sp.]